MPPPKRISRSTEIALYAIVAAVAVAVLYSAFVEIVKQGRENDISRFVVAGDADIDGTRVPPGLTLRHGSSYDGVAFYYLALAPFTRSAQGHGIHLDNPAYRQQRIGYPLIVWMLSLGDPARVPLLLVLVNLAALVAIAVLGVLLAGHFDAHPIVGVLFAFYPGFLMSLSRDTCEIVACAFALAGVVAFVRNRPLAAALLLSCAVLTRETSLLLVLGFAAAHLLQRFRRSTAPVPAVVFVLPILFFVAWQWLLASWWGVVPVRSGSPGLALPFAEFWKFFQATLSRRIHLQRLYFNESVYVALLILGAAAAWLRSRAPLGVRLAWCAVTALAMTLPAVMWSEDFAFLRIFADLFLTSSMVILALRRAAMRWVLLAATAAIWFEVADHIVQLG